MTSAMSADQAPEPAAVPAPVSRAERKRNELRQEIIDTAFACFAEQGYHATGIADIAARLGIGHGTFYRYFENKRDIIDHVLRDVITRIIAATGAENAPEAATTLREYREQCERIAEAVVGLIVEDPRVFRILLVEATSVDPALTDQVLDFLETATALIAPYLAHGVELGYLRPDLDVDNTARAINGMIVGGILHGLRRPEADATRQLADAVLAVMFDGIAYRH